MIFEQLALALKKKQSCPGNFHCSEYTFYIQDFWATCACPEKNRVPWIHCTEYLFFIIRDFWATCTCPEKQSCPGVFTVMKIRFAFICEQLALALKNRGCSEFTVLNIYFLLFRIFEQMRLPWKKNRVAQKFFIVLKYISSFRIFEQLVLALKNKQSDPGNFHCSEYTFTFRIFNNLRLPSKQSFPWNFSMYWIYFLLFRIFEQLALALKKRVPWIYCTEYLFFIIQDFWATCACPEKQSCPGIFHCIEYISSFRIFDQLALALKTTFALKFFKSWGAATPPPRTSYAYVHRRKEKNTNTRKKTRIHTLRPYIVEYTLDGANAFVVLSWNTNV